MSMEPVTENTLVVIGETRIQATVEQGFTESLKNLILEARRQIESMIAADPFFQMTYAPYPMKDTYGPIISKMCEAAAKADVGPMAAVAGAIDGYVLDRLIENGCRHAVLDNDGDIAMISDSPVRIGLCASLDGIPDMGITLHPDGEPLSICTSSGRIGHSVSLGNSDLASVIAYDPALADACATALGNSAASDPIRESERICAIEGVVGCLLIADGDAVICGDFPEPKALRAAFRCA